MLIALKQNSTYYESHPWVKVSSSWNRTRKVWIKEAGTWEPIYTLVPEEWVQQVLDSDHRVQGLAFDGGVFVAGTWNQVNGSMYTSSDGLTWSSTSWVYSPVTELVYTGSAFLADTSDEYEIARSTDGGQSWSLEQTFNGYIDGLACGDGVCLLGIDYAWRSTDDGQSWSQVNHTIDAFIYAIEYGDGVFLLADYGTSIGDAENLWRSTDGGQSWSLVLQDVRLSAIKYIKNGIFVAGTDVGGDIWRSTDHGQSWSQIASGLSCEPRDFAYSGYAIVGVGRSNNGYILTSIDDGLTWEEIQTQMPLDMYCITYGAGQFVAGGSDGAVWVSV